jgi:type I restriction enzyme S subunit
VSELPKGWVKTKIGDVTTVVAGGTPKAGDKSNFAERGKGIAWLTPADLSKYGKKSISHGSRDLSPQGLKSSSAKLMPKGTILFSSRAPIGYTVIAENEIATNQGFKNFVLPKGLNSSYTYYYLKSIKHIAESMGTGTTFKELSGAVAKTLPFVLAPTNEQIRIADKLDSMLAKVDAAQGRLDKIPNILKRFRQSVLAAATSGELTKEWREAKEANIDKWEVLRLEDVCNSVTDGDHQAPPKAETGVPFLVISNVNKGVVDLDKASRWVPQSYFDSLKDIRKPLKGDILYTVTGSYGIPVKVHDDTEFCFQRHIAILKPNHSLVDKEYLFHFLSSSNAFEQATKHATGTAQKTLPLRGLRGFEVAVPSMDEQKEIVRRVGAVFNMADTVVKQYLEAKTRTNRLTQSILAKAFRGELIPQDPTDEPAEKLLEKIKLEHLKENPITGKKKAAAKSKKVVNLIKADSKKAPIKDQLSGAVEVNLTDEKTRMKNWLGTNAPYAESAIQKLKGATFSTEQFQSVTGFDKTYEELKTLILSLVKGFPGISEPLIEIVDWEEKTGEYNFKLKDLK